MQHAPTDSVHTLVEPIVPQVVPAPEKNPEFRIQVSCVEMLQELPKQHAPVNPE
jgi:hypothetical protein